MNEVKRRIVEEVCRQLENELLSMTRAAVAAHDAATHAESKPENDKDTRSVEAAYLAGAQAARARTLQEAISRLETLPLTDFTPETPISAGALVTLHGAGESAMYLVLPTGGGFEVAIEAHSYQTTTPSSPLGAVLLGAQEGDEIEFESPTGLKEFEIESVK